MGNKREYVLAKIVSVLDSCKTQEQKEIAVVWAQRVLRANGIHSETGMWVIGGEVFWA